MNETKLPTLESCAAAVGITPNTPQSGQSPTIDQKALEFACVDLICKLENTFARAKQVDAQEFIDESANTARSMLSLLNDFYKESLHKSEQADEAIDKAMAYSHAFDQVLKTRSFGRSFIRTFWNIEEPSEIKQAHTQLAEALICACTAIFYHAVALIGFDSTLGREIDQSIVTFMAELRQSW